MKPQWDRTFRCNAQIPTVIPVTRKAGYRGSINDIEDKSNYTGFRKGDIGKPGFSSAWTSDDNPFPIVGTIIRERKQNPVGSHYHSGHTQIDEGIFRRFFTGNGYPKDQVLHRLNRAWQDFQGDISISQWLCARPLWISQRAGDSGEAIERRLIERTMKAKNNITKPFWELRFLKIEFKIGHEGVPGIGTNGSGG